MWNRTYLVVKTVQSGADPLAMRPTVSIVTATARGTRSRTVSTLHGRHVQNILTRIRDRDGLCGFTPHVGYLIGSNKSAFDSSAGSGQGGGGLDIADKTQLILQSTHPVRFVVEREIRALKSRSELDLKYLDWVTIFGRSLVHPTSKLKASIESNPEAKLAVEDKLGNVGTAAECGMFSADVHQTVVNITANLQPNKIRSEFHLGNKYAVLVGDYFAIKTIYFAEKVKSSPVFLEIIRGVEDFTYSSFVSKLLDSEVGFPIIPCAGATVHDWIAYGSRVSGYFTGGLKAAFTLLSILQDEQQIQSQNHQTIPNGYRSDGNEHLQVFVTNLALMLKAISDLNDFEFPDSNYLKHNSGSAALLSSSVSLSPFLFISLPAILYQERNKEIFSHFRSSEYHFNAERVLEIRQLISQNNAIFSQSRELIRKFASNAEEAFGHIGQDEFYREVMFDLIRYVKDSS